MYKMFVLAIYTKIFLKAVHVDPYPSAVNRIRHLKKWHKT